MVKQQRMTTKQLTLSALLLAVITVCAQIQIPLVVPINMGLFAVCLTAGLLGKKYGVLTVGGYILAGALGLPVFAGFMGGPAALVGKTGGYILGYLLTAWLVGWGVEKYGHDFKNLWFFMFLGTLSCYFGGTVWFVFLTGLDLKAALLYCVVPFIIGDLVKITLAVTVVKKMDEILLK